MDDLFKILPGVIAPVPVSRGERRQGVAPAGANFAAVLDRQIPAVRFSRHAQERMANRGISMSPDELLRLNRAVSSVEAKGGRDSLVLLDDKALVVSVKNQTVVTVVDREGLKENVFTNIDSAIIA
ncbi:MAG: flagellar protein [Desulfobulbaceae bacterium]|nr:flagellar protein [Desulfobulbaceae bacterium]